MYTITGAGATYSITGAARTQEQEQRSRHKSRQALHHRFVYGRRGASPQTAFRRVGTGAIVEHASVAPRHQATLENIVQITDHPNHNRSLLEIVFVFELCERTSRLFIKGISVLYESD